MRRLCRSKATPVRRPHRIDYCEVLMQQVAQPIAPCQARRSACPQTSLCKTLVTVGQKRTGSFSITCYARLRRRWAARSVAHASQCAASTLISRPSSGRTATHLRAGRRQAASRAHGRPIRRSTAHPCCIPGWPGRKTEAVELDIVEVATGFMNDLPLGRGRAAVSSPI